MIVAVNAIYAIASRGLNPWPRDTGAMLYQLSYEVTDVGSRSIVGSYVPVKEMSVNEMKMKKWLLQWTQFMQLRKEAWKNSGLQRGLNPWPRDTGAMLYQLSYEATDVGSSSIVGSYVPVKEMSVNDIWNKSYVNCENEMKMKKWSSQWNFSGIMLMNAVV